MRYKSLLEVRKTNKFTVVFSKEIAEKIEDIVSYNKNNSAYISEFHNYIDSMVNYISNPVIAWDNQGRYTHSKNGYTHIVELGFDITYMIKINQATNKSYIFVVEAKLVPDGLDLNIPYYMTESNKTNRQRIRLTENGLRRIIKKCLYETLYKLDRNIPRTTLNEGYSGKHFESQVNTIVQDFVKHKQLVDSIIEKQGCFYDPYSNYEIKISLKPFFKNGEVPSKFRKNKSYYIRIKYDWEKVGNIVTGFYNPKLLHKTDFQIHLTVPNLNYS